MEYGICLISLVPMRAYAEESSEQVNQLLFGDLVQVLEKKDKWLLVQLLSDHYQGWVSAGSVRLMGEEELQRIQQCTLWVSHDLVQVLENKTRNTSFLLTAGSSMYGCYENSFELMGDTWHYKGEMVQVDGFMPDTLVNHALLFLNSPYMWGGRSALGLDCSGFTQLVFKMAGKRIHRDASQQATQGEMIDLIHEARPGDLLFFDNEEGEVIHTGILIDDDQVVHAHHWVRVDKVDHYGIFNTQTGKYSHKLRLIKRFTD